MTSPPRYRLLSRAGKDGGETKNGRGREGDEKHSAPNGKSSEVNDWRKCSGREWSSGEIPEQVSRRACGQRRAIKGKDEACVVGLQQPRYRRKTATNRHVREN